uniref:Uncharacterized protein n=1 Tax=Arion vulgaris TaxID=1028688 RepID=A0A0B6YG17_9EUPU
MNLIVSFGFGKVKDVSCMFVMAVHLSTIYIDNGCLCATSKSVIYKHKGSKAEGLHWVFVIGLDPSLQKW